MFMIDLMRQSLRVSIGDSQEHTQKHESTDQILTGSFARGPQTAAEVAEAAAIAAWKHAAGDGLKEHAVPLKLEHRTLTVAVADAIWQKQLHSMRGQLLFRVNSILGQPVVGAIEFVDRSEALQERRPNAAAAGTATRQ